MSYSQSWLENPLSIRIVLVVVSALDVVANQEVTFNFSTSGYVTTDGYIFDASISNEITLQESLSLEGTPSMTFGDVQLSNINGEYDILLDSSKYLWSNRDIKIYFGDPSWKYTYLNIPSTFLNIFNGVIDDIDSKDSKSINFKIRDKLEKINTPISENKIGTYGTWASGQQNSDQIRPIVLGECFNVTPVLVDPSTLEYCFGTNSADQLSGFTINGESEKLLEIRDNGVPIFIDGNTQYAGATVNITNSTFKLLKTPAGALTCSVQGIKKSMGSTGTISNTYLNTIPSILGVVLTTMGKSSTRLTTAEIDFPTFNDFNQISEVGLLINGTDSVLSVCTNIVNSLGGQLIMSRTGQLRLIRYGVPISTTIVPSVSITVDDILYDSLNISLRIPVISTIKLGYAQNYTVQNNLVSSIPESSKKNFETEWLTYTSINTSVSGTYKLEKEVEQKNTVLVSTADATSEADRLVNFYSSQKIVYKFTGTAKLLSLVLGQRVVLSHHRFNLSSGKQGQVVSLSPNWLRDTVEVEVLVEVPV